jgi:hypothetical protein
MGTGARNWVNANGIQMQRSVELFSTKQSDIMRDYNDA